jgi:hypothetical protein
VVTGALAGTHPGTGDASGDWPDWPDLAPGSVAVTEADLADAFGGQIARELTDLAVFYVASDVGDAMGYDIDTGTGGPLSATVVVSADHSSAPLIVSAPSIEAAAAAGTVVVATVVPAGPSSQQEAGAVLADFAGAAELAGVETVVPVGAGGVLHVPQDEGEAAGTFPLAGVVVPHEAAFAAVGLSVHYRLGAPGGYETRIVAETWPPPDLDGTQFASYDTLVAIAHATAVPTDEDQMTASELGDLMATVNDIVGIGRP